MCLSLRELARFKRSVPAMNLSSAKPNTESMKRKAKIRLLLVDDHPVVRKGIRSCLTGLEHLDVVGEATDGQGAISQVMELKPDIVLMDIDMPNMNGLEATRL